MDFLQWEEVVEKDLEWRLDAEDSLFSAAKAPDALQPSCLGGKKAIGSTEDDRNVFRNDVSPRFSPLFGALLSSFQ